MLIRTCVHREQAHRRPVRLLVDFFFKQVDWKHSKNWLFLFLKKQIKIFSINLFSAVIFFQGTWTCTIFGVSGHNACAAQAQHFPARSLTGSLAAS